MTSSEAEPEEVPSVSFITLVSMILFYNTVGRVQKIKIIKLKQAYQHYSA